MLKYEELVNTIKAEIASGTYAKGDRLPTTPEICRIYGVSNTTVKRAMDDLELQGLVARRRGSGVYVKQTVTSSSARATQGGSASGQMTGLSAELGAGHVRSVIYDFSVVHPSDEVCEALGLEDDEFAYHICRVRVVDGTPKVIEYTYMPINLIPGLRENTIEHSIYQFIEKELGLKIDSAHRAVRAKMPTVEEQKELDLDGQTPVLEVEQVGFLDDGEPFEYSISRHAGNRYDFYTVAKH